MVNGQYIYMYVQSVKIWPILFTIHSLSMTVWQGMLTTWLKDSVKATFQLLIKCSRDLYGWFCKLAFEMRKDIEVLNLLKIPAYAKGDIIYTSTPHEYAFSGENKVLAYIHTQHNCMHREELLIFFAKSMNEVTPTLLFEQRLALHRGQHSWGKLKLFVFKS